MFKDALNLIDSSGLHEGNIKNGDLFSGDLQYLFMVLFTAKHCDAFWTQNSKKFKTVGRSFVKDSLKMLSSSLVLTELKLLEEILRKKKK